MDKTIAALLIILASAVIAGPIYTYGHAKNNLDDCLRNCSFEASGAALLWPFYWSDFLQKEVKSDRS